MATEFKRYQVILRDGSIKVFEAERIERSHNDTRFYVGDGVLVAAVPDLLTHAVVLESAIVGARPTAEEDDHALKVGRLVIELAETSDGLREQRASTEKRQGRLHHELGETGSHHRRAVTRRDMGRNGTMRIGFFDQHWTDDEDRPAGGVTSGRGFTISWQNGPLGPLDGDRKEPNGAFVEDVIEACKQRIEFYQTASDGRFACGENADAILHLEIALKVLDQRTNRRVADGSGGHAPGGQRRTALGRQRGHLRHAHARAGSARPG